MMDPVLPGYEIGGEVPSYSFLIHHRPSNTRLLFDLSLRTNWESAFPPPFIKGLRSVGLKSRAGQDIADILATNGVDASEIEGVIFSHHHFDHTGDMTKFPKSVKVIVGPGYTEAFLPSWPTNKEQIESTADLYEGREVMELSFAADDPKVSTIGGFPAYDYFSDGSFYILSTPGHTIGHLSALSRTTSGSGKSSFVFMGGDIVHVNAVFRPTSKHPLPQSIPVPNSKPFSTCACLSESFARMHRLYSQPRGDQLARTTPFCKVAGPEHDLVESQSSADKLADFDGEEDVFVISAHDATLLEVMEFFPQKANDWKVKGWKEEGHWRWLAPCMKSTDNPKL